MHKKLLAVFAHPDDEAFGPAGTLAKYAREGIEVHLLCVTRGEAGDNNIKNQKSKIKDTNKKIKLEHIREKELLDSAKILGIKKVEFLDFIDGTLSNAVYHQVANKIIKKINDFKPQIVLTVERRGVSGHLDHIATSMITTYAYKKTKIARKLYYNCIPKELRNLMSDDYFVYFPEGYKQSEITTRIDYSCCWKEKVDSMMAHKSQIKDAKILIKRFAHFPKIDHFILQYYQNINLKLPETDLFAGLD